MLKRPIFAVAVVLAMAIAVIYGFFPYMLKPQSGYEAGEQITVTGDVWKVERRTDQVRVFLKHLTVGTIGSSSPATVPGTAVLLLTSDQYASLEIRLGNRLCADCGYRAFHHARNYGNFEEEEYYTSLGIFLMAEAEQVTVTDRHTDLFRQFLNDLRERLVTSIYEAVRDPETAGILAAICTGDRSGLTDETRQIYQSSGIIHILAVSGLHISLIGMTLFRLLRKRFRYPFSAVISMLVMLGFCIMSSASASAVRATIMFAVQILGIGLGKKYDIICSMSLAAILMLLNNPLMIANAAFQLSFAAVLGVGFVYPAFECCYLTASKSSREVPVGKDRKFYGLIPEKHLSSLKDRILSGFLMSLSVNLTVLPIVISAYYEISVYSVLLNLIVIPFMSLILGTGLASSAAGMLSILIGRFLAGIGVLLVISIRWLCELIERLPGSNLVVGALSAKQIVFYYLLLILLTAGIWWMGKNGMQGDLHSTMVQPEKYPVPGSFRHMRGAVQCILKAFTRSVRQNRLWRTLILTMGFLLLMIVLFVGKGHPDLRISFIDVGQGDGILIENPSGSIYLIDGGSSSVQQVAKYNLSGAVKYYGISRIDYVMITHPDDDHISGIREILENMGTVSSFHLSVSNILIPYVPGNTHYTDLVELASEKGVRVWNLHTGLQISDHDLQITCLHPDTGYRSDSTNGYSAVLDIRYGEFSALMTGDLEADGEDIVLPLLPIRRTTSSGYDLLKVAHHGSRFSSSQEFLETVSPEIAIISAGVNNIYGHPHEETLDRLRSVGAEVYATAWCGEIIMEASLDGSYTIRHKLHDSENV